MIQLRWIPVFALALAACGGQEEPPAEETAPAPSAQDTAAAVEPTVHAMLMEWTIDLGGRDTLDAGPVKFLAMNHGQREHSLEVEGQGIEAETAKIAPGSTDSVTVELKPGTYEVYCPVEDDQGKHKDMGMRATIVVR